MKFIKSILVLLYIVLHYSAANAQTDTPYIDLKVGDSVVLGSCSNVKFGFMAIDIVTKTRWIDRGLPYDSVTGAGFYNYFFNEGDFDSGRLPCKFSGLKFKVAGFQTIKNEEDKDQLIIFGRINDDPLTALWIVADAAIALKELVF